MASQALLQRDSLPSFHPCNGKPLLADVAANDPRAQAVVNNLRTHGNLSRACREAGVSPTTFYDWKDALPALAEAYTRAKEIGLQCAADKAFEDALTATDAGLGRLALDASKWYLCHLLPKIFGDKQQVEHSGGLDLQVTDTSPQLQTLAASMRQLKRTQPVILEGETVAPRARIKAPQDAPVPRVEHKPEDISDLI